MEQEQKRTRVLVVDDNDVVRRVLSGIIRQDDRLRLLGEATNGAAALEVVRKQHPEVVCLDVMMPGLNGLEVLKKLREDAPHTKVVMITGYATADLITSARELGVAGFVIKPFNAAKVLVAIHSAVGRLAQ